MTTEHPEPLSSAELAELQRFKSFVRPGREELRILRLLATIDALRTERDDLVALAGQADYYHERGAWKARAEVAEGLVDRLRQSHALAVHLLRRWYEFEDEPHTDHLSKLTADTFRYLETLDGR